MRNQFIISSLNFSLNWNVSGILQGDIPRIYLEFGLQVGSKKENGSVMVQKHKVIGHVAREVLCLILRNLNRAHPSSWGRLEYYVVIQKIVSGESI